MNTKTYIKLFLFAGFFFGLCSIGLCFMPKKTDTYNDDFVKVVNDIVHTYKQTNAVVNYGDAYLGTLATGIISACCFFVAGNLIKSNNKI